MFWPTFSCFIASLVLSTWAFPTEHQDGKESEGIKKKGDIWAVLVAGSDGWGNYRHQADVCHAWQILTAHGVKPENIITMMYDDIANNTWNKYPGKIFNSPNGIDVYGGVKIDYRGEEVNVGNLKAVLLGNETATNGKPVLKSSNNDKVFVYYTDHGGPGVLGMPTSPSLYLKDVTETLEEMHANEMYKEMTFYLEACHSGSMFETEFLKKLNIYAVSASNAHESSWGYYCPGDCKECEKWADTCLGDLFSINWLEDSDKPDLRRETLTTQFGIVKNKTAATNTTYGSEVLAFGRLQIQQQYVSEFLGRKRARKQGSEGDVTFAAQIPESAQFSAYKAGDIPLMMLAQREEKGDKAAAPRYMHSKNILEEPVIKKARLFGNGQFCQQKSNGTVMPAKENENTPASQQPVANVSGGDDAVDTNLYSRQIYALGESAMSHLRKASVLVSGIGSVGLEIAKNLILGGVRHVTLHDQKNLSYTDLSAHFFATEANIGQNRVKVCFKKLAELNDTVNCAISTDPLTDEFVTQFDLIVMTDAPWEEQLKVNAWVHKNGKKFISADARGLFAYAFVDLGGQFAVTDPDGEACKEILLEHINCETGELFTLEGTLHGLEDGDHIVFEDFEHKELNNLAPVPIKTTKKGSILNVGKALAAFSKSIEGPITRGRVKEVKMTKIIAFKPLQEALKEPNFLIWDFAKFDEPAELHALWQALYNFEKKHRRSPQPRSIEDAQLLKNELPEGAPEITENLLNNFSYQATGNLQPIASVIGGLVAQEAMKAVTHHTTPLQQFLYTDSLEALPGDYSTFDAAKLKPEDCAPRKSRYDGQAAVFGWAFQEAIQRQRWFIVGAGAIGCELLKNVALMGLACGEGGQLKITDPDTIEVSNLNRQFLFRRPDVGKKKSEVAARAVKDFNPAVNIQPLAEIISEATEQVFNDEFFKHLNGVCNALDNVEARRYVDRRCVYYQLPLLESGTMGTKGNTQVVYPHLTESYSSTSDPPEKETPVCTLRNFPYQIHHTIQWGNAKFNDYFTSIAETVNQYLDDVRGFLDRMQGQMSQSQQIELLRTLNKALVDDFPNSGEDCVRWARHLFDQLYRNEIMQLLHNFPKDQVTSQGQRFWSGTKRCPHPLHFNVDDPEHLEFVYSASIIRAQLYNIDPIVDRAKVAQLAKAYQSKPFAPREGVRIAVTDAEAANEAENGADGDDAERILDTLNVSLARLRLDDIRRLTPIDFEKDDDTNHHVDFVTATSNLRAENYDIEKADRMKTKQIAGKIIPALATTTAVVSGLVCVELYKTIAAADGTKAAPIEIFKNAFLNLAIPFIAFSEPGKAAKKKYRGIEFTLWDRLEVQGPKTMGQLIDWIEEQTGLTLSMMSTGVSLCYAFFQPENRKQERRGKDIIKVVEEVSRQQVPPYRRALVFEMIMQNAEDEDVEIPYVKYNFR